MRKKTKIQAIKNKNSTLGFTLIELLVVMAIIGILTSLLVANFAQIRSRARDSQRKSDLNQIKKALQMYYDDQKAYPTQAADPGFVFGGSFTSGAADAPYMGLVPQDVIHPAESYFYIYNSSNDTYRLEATLENLSDKDIAPSQKRCGFPAPTPGIYMVCPD